MLHPFNDFPVRGSGVAQAPLAAVLIAAGIVLAATPATAATSDWRAACGFAAAPQNYGDQIRYNNCIRQADCQNLANSVGHTVFNAGCFWVAPDPVAPPVTRGVLHAGH